MITSTRKRYLIPLATAGLGIAALGTGIGFALTGHELALLPVGTSNLATVLAITGTAAFIFSLFALYRVAGADSLSIKKVIPGTNMPNGNGGLPLGYTTQFTAIMAVAGIAMTAATYGAIHQGIAPFIPVEWGVGASMGIQVGAGFIIGCIVDLITIASVWRINGREIDKQSLYEARRLIIWEVIGAGVLGAAASVAGPALTTAMGIAAHTAEGIALEALIAVSLSSLLLGVWGKMGLILDANGCLGKNPQRVV